MHAVAAQCALAVGNDQEVLNAAGDGFDLRVEAIGGLGGAHLQDNLDAREDFGREGVAKVVIWVLVAGAGAWRGPWCGRKPRESLPLPVIGRWWAVVFGVDMMIEVRGDKGGAAEAQVEECGGDGEAAQQDKDRNPASRQPDGHIEGGWGDQSHEDKVINPKSENNQANRI